MNKVYHNCSGSVNTADAVVTLVFATEFPNSTNKANPYFEYSWVTSHPDNATDITVTQHRDGTLVRTLLIAPGGGFADHIACDTITITKSTAADDISYGGAW